MNEKVVEALKRENKWLVTGCAGFIGSHLVEYLLGSGQTVRGIDNYSTGYKYNIDLLANDRFTFIEGDINDLSSLNGAMDGVSYVLHMAALGSVPRSIKEPKLTACANVEGFTSIAKSAADLGVKRVVYASSSSVYGDIQMSPKVEDKLGDPLSPYAASKLADEIFAVACSKVYDINFVGLRYFNVFGPRQSPDGAYAAVIPKWIDAMVTGDQVIINGDSSISRDFTYITNVIEANVLSAIAPDTACNTAYNIANGAETTLAQLYHMIAQSLISLGAIEKTPEPIVGPPRAGDVKNSLADISKARKALGYDPKVEVDEGLNKTVEWFYNKGNQTG